MTIRNRLLTALVGCLGSLTLTSLGQLVAQETPPMPPGAKGAPMPPNQPPSGAPPGQPPGAPPGQPVKPGEKPAAGPGAPGKTEPAEPGRPRRKPSSPANPDELKVRPDEEGLVSFSFKNQDWENVLEWLADASQMSLNMEEVPPGFLNLTTRGKYEIHQVRDLINSVLITKGYTLLVDREVLILIRLEKLDKTLVPRVPPDELDSRGTYEFVKTFFDLDWLVAETVAEDLKSMLSPNGKITALKSTNRIDVLETAGNMRRIRDMLKDEQENQGGELVREFELTHARADAVLDTLNTLLGIKSKSSPAPMTPEQMQQAQQAAAMAAQQAAQRGGQPPGAAKEPQIYLAVNRVKNSILANAPADKMSVIAQAIRALDVAHDREDSLLANLPRLRPYRLTAVDPSAVVKVLLDLGNLDPRTRLEVDTRSKSIIAFATPLDHIAIQAIVQKIDGTGRRFEVIQLHYLDAEMAAGSIEFLMRGGSQESSRGGFDPFFGFYDRGSRSQQKDPADQLQVEADTERNRLLLRATDVELAEIRDLLAKLGELPEDGRNAQTLRVIPMSPGDMQQLIQNIQNNWPSIGRNPLKIGPVPKPPEEKEESREPETEPANGASPKKAAARLRAIDARGNGEVAGRNSDADSSVVKGVALRSPVVEHPAEQRVELAEAQDQPPADGRSEPQDSELRRFLPRGQETMPEQADPSSTPVTITFGADGLIISSQDTEALDRMEDLVSRLMPDRLGSRIFTLKNTYAKDVADLLKEVFKEGEEKRSNFFDDGFYYYRYGPGSRSQEKPRGRLSKRRTLKFIPDPVTNTLLVQGADAGQLAEIERLIQLYDNPEPPNSNSVRTMEKISVHYTTAKEVSEVIKDVFRDLLSPNDKSMAKQGQQQEQQARSLYSTTYIIGGDAEKDSARKFKGLLSIGVDERSNTLVVSAPRDLMLLITSMVRELDEAARQTRGVTQVLNLGSTVTSEQIRSALSTMGRPATATSNTPPEGNQQAGQGQPGQQGKGAPPQGAAP